MSRIRFKILISSSKTIFITSLFNLGEISVYCILELVDKDELPPESTDGSGDNVHISTEYMEIEKVNH